MDDREKKVFCKSCAFVSGLGSYPICRFNAPDASKENNVFQGIDPDDDWCGKYKERKLGHLSSCIVGGGVTCSVREKFNGDVITIGSSSCESCEFFDSKHPQPGNDLIYCRHPHWSRNDY